MGREEGQNGPDRGLRARMRHRQAARVADGIRVAAEELAREGGEVYRRLEPEARALGRAAARDGGRLVGGLLLGVLGAVFALIAVLAAVAFGVVALAGPLPTWAAGLIGALALALLALASLRLARREVGRLGATRRLARYGRRRA